MVATIGNMEVHPAANLFAMLSKSDMDVLRADIEAHGQREPCTTYQGKLLDGRNRYQCCLDLGIKPQTVEIEADDSFDPHQYVASMNLHRRHLTKKQRALIGVKLLKQFEKRAKQMSKEANQTPGGTGATKGKRPKSRDKAAEIVNVSPRTIQNMKAIEDKGSPELIDAVNQKEVSIATAAKVARTVPRDQQQAAVKETARSKKTTAASIREAETPTEIRFIELWQSSGLAKLLQDEMTPGEQKWVVQFIRDKLR